MGPSGTRWDSRVRCLPAAQHERDGTWNEAISLAIDQRHVSHGGERMDAIREWTAGKRSDADGELLVEVRGRESNDPVDHDPPSIRCRTILGGSVQHAAMDEGRLRGPGRSH